MKKYGLNIDDLLFNFIEAEALPGTGIEPDAFWKGFSEIANGLAPKNRTLLKFRDDLQAKIDDWNKSNRQKFDAAAYNSFLTSIGYLVPEGPDFKVTTQNVDPEIALVAGPQLVVPVSNARFALNAANARWGSLYDALYGTDALGHPSGKVYDPIHGAKVIAWARGLLDVAAPLKSGKWAELKSFSPDALKDQTQFAGKGQGRDSVLLRNHGLHIELIFDRSTEIGKSDALGISDIIIESAVTTIMDCEDSVAAVDAEDKVLVYHNWLGLMKGDLSEEISKGGKTFTRKLNPDRQYIDAANKSFTLPGRSLMLVRNVGHLMTNPAIRLEDGSEIPEGIMDAMITSTIALHDVGKNGRQGNSRAGSVYIVKPKMHGPEEVAFACEIFSPRRSCAGH